ncbi:hypothetical protein FO519_008257 [Halicephalobus sp. NKZ332]|nr:hypothetical protein FO519_008257 [Halicephalobus sp. NKZ332]
MKKLKMNNLKKVLVFQKSRRRNRARIYFILLLGLFSCFFIYTVIVLGNGVIVAMNGLRERALEGEEVDDDVAKVLGGPDEDPEMKPLASDLVAIEKTLMRLLRVKRDVTEEYGEIHKDEDHTHAKMFKEKEIITKSMSGEQCANRNANTSVDVGDESLFPTDLFSIEQRRKGAIFFHFVGLIYSFIALAIVCDEFFVPALGVITEALEISDDVAGATFMAAGGSAPEFFTSVFGVFITQNNVGIGTIVGSATFNILCVLAFCTLFSKKILYLTWWPLFRDMSFYVVALLCLVLFFIDEAIDWHEALTMFVIYVIYGIFMKYNSQIERLVKSKIFKGSAARNDATQNAPAVRRRSLGAQSGEDDHRKSIQTIPVLHSGAMFRAGIAQMVLEEDDSIIEDAPGSLPVTSRTEEPEPPKVINNGKVVTISAANPELPKTASQPAYHGKTGVLNGTSSKTNGISQVELQNSTNNVSDPRKTPKAVPTSNSSLTNTAGGVSEASSFANPVESLPKETKANGSSGMYPKLTSQLSIPQILDQEEEVEQPIDMSWPKTFRKQLMYLFLTPIMWPLYITLPDVKKPNRKKLVIITFVGSVLWIAFYSYLMVWWANTIGVTLGIPTEVMGLTVLAAGTSIPDLITSVIVARKGLGDMAVSSSIGSNLFDICVGLPIPWLLYFLYQFFSNSGYSSVTVISNGLVCSVGTLFGMMILLVVTTALSGWKMSKSYGIIMIFSYILFCLYSVLLELRKVSCPLRIAGLRC